jgi:hypothetical protein
MDSSPLATLPVELIFRILDFLSPTEYTGFSCTCRHAVTLVNSKLDNAEDDFFFWFGLSLSDSQALFAQFPSWKSRTARWVGRKKVYDLMIAQYIRETQYECLNYGTPDDDDADL